MRNTLEFAAPVPIVGQAFTVHEGIAMATVTCRCRPDNVPMVIPHVDVVKACTHCRHVYAITAILFNRNQGHVAPSVTVRDLGPQPLPGAVDPQEVIQ